MCAIAIAEANRTGEPWLLRWLGSEVIWRISVGVAVRALVGYAFGWIVFRIPNRAKLSRSKDGFVALGITVIVYGIAESFHGYGFLSVFVAALALRAAERNHEYREKLHDFTEQLERLLMMVVLVLFGGAIVGGLLNALTWQSVTFSLIAVLAVRPLAGWLSLSASPVSASERLAISFFGIRGTTSRMQLNRRHLREPT